MATKKKKATRGYRETTVQKFLGLTDHESAMIDFKLSLMHAIRERRKAHGVTQAQLAQTAGSTQPKVAKAESPDPSVTIDFRLRLLVALGLDLKAMAAAAA